MDLKRHLRVLRRVKRQQKQRMYAIVRRRFIRAEDNKINSNIAINSFLQRPCIVNQ